MKNEENFITSIEESEVNYKEELHKQLFELGMKKNKIQKGTIISSTIAGACVLAELSFAIINIPDLVGIASLLGVPSSLTMAYFADKFYNTRDLYNQKSEEYIKLDREKIKVARKIR